MDVTQTAEWEALVRNYTDTGFTRRKAEEMATAEMNSLLN